MIAASPAGGGEGTRRPWRAVLPLASGIMLAAATPPALSPLFPFVALVPLAVHLLRTRMDGRATLEAVGGGMLTGAVQHGWGLRWLPFTLTAVAGPVVGWLAFAAVLAALAACTGAAAWGVHRLLTGPRPLPVALALPVTWTALEWGLAHLPFGLAFPWTPLGLGLARWPETLGLAELIGVGGVSAWLACVNGLMAGAVVRASASVRAGMRPALPFAAAAMLVALLPVAWGFARARAFDRGLVAAPVGRVAALALAVPPTASDPAWTATAVDAAVRALEGVSGGAADLVVLPEMILALDPASPAGAFQVERLRIHTDRLDAPLLVGTLGVEGSRAFNSAVLLSVGESIGFRADKRHLVPGVERASAVRAPWLAPSPAPGGSQGYAPGEGWPVAVAGPLRVGVLLCYEVAFGSDARALVRNGANAFAALTSDAWFAGGSGARAAGIAQQMAHLTVRVVETRTGAVRSSNGGPAALLGPSGREEGRTAPGVLAGVVHSAPDPTLFVRMGDFAGPLAVLTLLLLLAATLRGQHLPEESDRSLINWKT